MPIPCSAKMAELSAGALRAVLDYDHISGVFRWKFAASTGRPAGSVAGNLSRGYIRIQIGGRSYFAHRLAWLFVHGVWPANYIDHVDGVRRNNAIANLRPATARQNQFNRRIQRSNASGFKGVHWEPEERKWYATIRINGQKKHLGRYDDPADAHRAYEAAAIAHHGEFARPS